jgi:hypothetical protein
MSPQDLLLEVFCLIDDELQTLRLGRLRARGPSPVLSDSEVVAIEVVGEFWKLGNDRDIYRHFRQHFAREFPALARVHRTTFARQAANLHEAKRLLQRRLAEKLAHDQPVWLADSMPVEGAKFARARFCKRFRGEADYGYDHGIKRTFWGFRLHALASRDGVVLSYRLAPARVSDRAMLEALDPPPGTTGIGDRGYHDPELRRRLEEGGVRLLTPFQHKSRDPDPKRSGRLAGIRYRLESVFGQLAERYGLKRTWARDMWHLCHRLTRKILSHTVMIRMSVRHGFPPLSFDKLLPAA